MSFLEPLFLFGALTIAIPIIIHLLKLNKPETVAFSTLAFFREMVDSTLQRLNIKRWILLILRTLALLALSIALAQPFFKTDPSAEAQRTSQLSLLIDNSPSTLFSDSEGIRFYRIIDHATELLSNLSSNASVYLAPTHGNWNVASAKSPAEALNLLKEIQPQFAIDMTQTRINSQIRQLKNGPEDAQLLFLHDAQQSALERFEGYYSAAVDDWSDLKESFKLGLLPSDSSISNVWIDGIELNNAWLSAGQQIQLNIKVAYSKNRVPLDSSLVLSMYVNDRMIGQLNPQQRSTFNFSPQKPGYYKLRAQIEGDSYPFDNQWNAALFVPAALNVLWVSDEVEVQQRTNKSMIQVLLAAQEAGYDLELQFADPASIPLDKLSQIDVIVVDGVKSWPTYLDEPLRSYVQDQGGGLWLIPSPNTDLSLWNQKMAFFDLPPLLGLQGELSSFEKISGIERIRGEHPVFRQMFDREESAIEEKWSPMVDAPSMYFYFQMRESSGVYALLQDDARNPLLVEKKLGNGRIWSSAFGFEPTWSDLSIKALFPPLVFNGLQYLNASDGTSFFYNVEAVAPLKITAAIDIEEDRIRTTLNDSLEFGWVRERQTIGQLSEWVSLDDQWMPGFIRYTSDETESETEIIRALNLPADEAIPNYASVEEFQEYFESDELISYQIPSSTKSENSPNSLSSLFIQDIWRWFILLGFIFLIAESLVSRFYTIQKN